MGRLFCYTLFARAIGATVSAGALHAQGWGFESLIAHHLIEKAPSDGGLSFLGPVQRDSNPPGCGAEETRKRLPAQHARSEATKRGAGGEAARGHPSSPTTELETVLERGPFLFGPISWDSNPPECGAEAPRSVFQRSTRGPQARSESGRRNGPLANTRVQKMPNMSTATFLMAAFSKS